jgi:hypothetical protein
VEVEVVSFSNHALHKVETREALPPRVMCASDENMRDGVRAGKVEERGYDIPSSELDDFSSELRCFLEVRLKDALGRGVDLVRAFPWRFDVHDVPVRVEATCQA